MIASIPDIASLPKRVLAAAVCSVSDKPLNFVLSSLITSIKGNASPFASVILILYFFMTSAIASVGDARFDRAVFKLVPAILPLTLALAISPSATDTSSTL